MTKQQEIKETKRRLKIVLDRLRMDQPPCQKRSDWRQRIRLLKKIKELSE